MKAGDVIHGYTVLRPFSTAGGGQSKWTFAAKGGKEYFLKQFLSPTFPVLGSPGSEATKERKRRQCEAFEIHHRRLMNALMPIVADGGNLIATKDFFRADAKYYKVTEKVDTTTLSPRDVAAFDIEQRVLILRTIAHSLAILHGQSIVHGDPKPTNVLIKRTATGKFTSKLIDFDNSFFSGDPPTQREELVGDLAYYSPEMALYINEDRETSGADVTTASDIFALGLLYSEYLTGSMPVFDRSRFPYAWMAAQGGSRLKLDSTTLPEKLLNLVAAMLTLYPASRPRIGEVYTVLRSEIRDIPDVVVPDSIGDGAGAKLKGSLVRRDKPLESPPSVASDSKLKGELFRKKES